MKVSGGLDADFAFTGDYYHAASGLYLTLFRAYDPDLGRWLGRDPSGEQSGLNLYAYVMNNPINAIDPLGLTSWGSWGKVGLDLVGIGASLVGLAVGGAAISSGAGAGAGVVVAVWSAYSLVANIKNLSNDLNGNDNETTSGLAQAIGEAVGGEGSDAAKAGEATDLMVALINPEVALTKLQEAVENGDSIHAAAEGISEAANDLGLWNFLKQLTEPFYSRGCPAGSGQSTGDPQKDLWNYIGQLSAGHGLY